MGWRVGVNCHARLWNLNKWRKRLRERKRKLSCREAVSMNDKGRVATLVPNIFLEINIISFKAQLYFASCSGILSDLYNLTISVPFFCLPFWVNFYLLPPKEPFLNILGEGFAFKIYPVETEGSSRDVSIISTLGEGFYSSYLRVPFPRYFCNTFVKQTRSSFLLGPCPDKDVLSSFLSPIDIWTLWWFSH